MLILCTLYLYRVPTAHARQLEFAGMGGDVQLTFTVTALLTEMPSWLERPCGVAPSEDWIVRVAVSPDEMVQVEFARPILHWPITFALFV